MAYPREPKDGWQVGDLAYCIDPRTYGPTTPKLERGRVYRVTHAWKPHRLVHHGLRVEGIDVGPAEGLLSRHFIKLSGTGKLAQIDAATEYTISHYWERLEGEPA